MKKSNLACVLTIAGTDPSGGAGIQADIKAISATGAYCASVITALVAQNTQGVTAIQPVASDFIHKQLAAVFNDLDIKAVKIGMLHDARIIECVYQGLLHYKPPLVVLDPVMIAKDGSPLLDLKAINLLKKQLFNHVYLMTPNLYEAEKLLGKRLETKEDMAEGAMALGQKHRLNVLIKGGHLMDNCASDVLYLINEDTCIWFEDKRIHTKNTHGTGCSLSAAIASFLGQGQSLSKAIRLAKRYLTAALESGAQYNLGKGQGPIDHFYQLRND